MQFPFFPDLHLTTTRPVGDEVVAEAAVAEVDTREGRHKLPPHPDKRNKETRNGSNTFLNKNSKQYQEQKIVRKIQKKQWKLINISPPCFAISDGMQIARRS